MHNITHIGRTTRTSRIKRRKQRKTDDPLLFIFPGREELVGNTQKFHWRTSPSKDAYGLVPSYDRQCSSMRTRCSQPTPLDVAPKAEECMAMVIDVRDMHYPPLTCGLTLVQVDERMHTDIDSDIKMTSPELGYNTTTDNYMDVDDDNVVMGSPSSSPVLNASSQLGAGHDFSPLGLASLNNSAAFQSSGSSSWTSQSTNSSSSASHSTNSSSWVLQTPVSSSWVSQCNNDLSCAPQFTLPHASLSCAAQHPRSSYLHPHILEGSTCATEPYAPEASVVSHETSQLAELTQSVQPAQSPQPDLPPPAAYYEKTKDPQPRPPRPAPEPKSQTPPPASDTSDSKPSSVQGAASRDVSTPLSTPDLSPSTSLSESSRHDGEADDSDEVDDVYPLNELCYLTRFLGVSYEDDISACLSSGFGRAHKLPLAVNRPMTLYNRENRRHPKSRYLADRVHPEGERGYDPVEVSEWFLAGATPTAAPPNTPTIAPTTVPMTALPDARRLHQRLLRQQHQRSRRATAPITVSATPAISSSIVPTNANAMDVDAFTVALQELHAVLVVPDVPHTASGEEVNNFLATVRPEIDFLYTQAQFESITL